MLALPAFEAEMIDLMGKGATVVRLDTDHPFAFYTGEGDRLHTYTIRLNTIRALVRKGLIARTQKEAMTGPQALAFLFELTEAGRAEVAARRQPKGSEHGT